MAIFSFLTRCFDHNAGVIEDDMLTNEVDWIENGDNQLVERKELVKDVHRLTDERLNTLEVDFRLPNGRCCTR